MAESVQTSRNLGIVIGYSCDQSCIFCSEAEGMDRLDGYWLSLEEIERVFTRMRGDGVEQMQLAGGGEPTLHPDFVDILRVARRLGMRSSVISNAQRFAEATFAAETLPLLDELGFSVHAHTPELHDRLTRKPGSFAKVVRAFENVREQSHLHLLTNTVVCRTNWEALEDTIAFLAGTEGVQTCRVTAMAPEGLGRELYAELAIELGQWRERIPALARICDGAGVKLQVDAVPLCVLGAYRDCSTDVDSVPEHWVWPLGRGLDQLAFTLLEKDTRCRKPLAVCHGCAEVDVCTWIFDEHVVAFGAAELEPVEQGSEAEAEPDEDDEPEARSTA